MYYLNFTVLLIVILPLYVKAKCVDQSTDLDSCLQCCTDTSRTAKVIKEYPQVLSELKSVCIKTGESNYADLSSKNAQRIYRRYGIEMSTISHFCAVDGTGIVLETYNDCVTTCRTKYTKRKRKK